MNTLFPGRPNYTGPKKGWFALLHHDCLFEHSHNVAERVEYVRKHKPKNEVPVRLYNMLYLGDCPAMAKYAALYADYDAKRGILSADYIAKCKPFHADYKTERAALDADHDALDADCKAKYAALDADYLAKRDALYAYYKVKCDALYADYGAERAPLNAEILDYINTQMPDCAWNGKTLVFPDA